jgi:hypothetical protein
MRKIQKIEHLICDACGHECNCFDDELWLCCINEVSVELCFPCVNSVERWAEFMSKYTENAIYFRVVRKYDAWKDSTIHE